MAIDCAPFSGEMSVLDWLIVAPLIPLAPILVTWWAPWERWIPWAKLSKLPLGLYFLYATYVTFHIYGCNWVVLCPLGFSIAFFVQAFRKRPNPSIDTDAAR